MNSTIQNLLLFVVLPYVALSVLVMGTVLRFRTAPHSFSSRSSQFLEGERHFWALTAFHFGVIVVFLGHLAGLVTPARMHVWTASPLRIHVLEVIGLAGALTALIGVCLVIHRRARVPLVAATTRVADAIVLALLAFQLLTGVYIAVSRPWAAAWFEALVGPYVRSLLALNPDMSYVAAMPVAIKVHLVSASVIIAVFPFTRLVHMLAVPVAYFWRKLQLVRWTRPRTAIASPSSATLARKAAAGRR
jgi:nitrate reductase gamma subunit